MPKITLAFIYEVLASSATLAGMYLGSTEKWGAACYLLSMVFWFALMFNRKLWGLLPLNVGALIVNLRNVWMTWT